MAKKTQGKLIVIGGALQNEGAEPILDLIAQTVKRAKGPLVVIDAASYEPDGLIAAYAELFRPFGLQQLQGVDIRTRDDAYDEAKVRCCAEAAVIFFTGGDQLRITSQIGDSPLFRCLRDHYERGGVIAGTSAGAAALPATMLIGGPSDESNRVSALAMAPGLGLLPDVVVDTHFAERGRIGRLLGAVAQNPRNLGLGLDEGTAAIVTCGESFEVLGAGAVYVVDGTGITYSSLSEEQAEGVVSIYGVQLHVLGQGDSFDLIQRCPIRPDQPR